MKSDLKKPGIIIVAALLLVELLLFAGCDVAAEDGAAELASATNTLATAACPAPRDLATVSTATGPCFTAAEILANDGGQPLHSGDSQLGASGLQIASSADAVGWAVYAAHWPDEATRPDSLHLEFGPRTGPAWLGLADYRQGTWRWQELPGRMTTDIYLDAGLGMPGGNLVLCLAVHDGATLTFVQGGISNSQAPPPEPEPDPAPEPDCPAINGAYISAGYWSPDEIDATFTALEEAGVNFVIDYALSTPEDGNWEDGFQYYLDAAAAHGIGVAFWLAGPLEGMTPDDVNGHFEAVTTQVEHLKHQPAIAAWYVHDEILPMIAGDAGTEKYSLSLTQMQELYRRIHTADPTRPQLNVWNFLPDFELFNNVYSDAGDTPFGRPEWMSDPQLFEQTLREMVQTTCDWVMIDMYPVGAPWRSPAAGPPELAVAALTRRAAELCAADQPLVFVYQAFSWAQYGSDGAPFPTRAEIDGMLCAANTYGADWAIAYSWFDLAEDLPDRDVPGRDEALATLLDVLGALNTTGWPRTELPVGMAQMEHPQPEVLTPNVYFD